jgi:hypothetical protein
VQIPGQLSPVAIVTFLVLELFVHAVASLALIPFPGGSHREIVRGRRTNGVEGTDTLDGVALTNRTYKLGIVPNEELELLFAGGAGIFIERHLRLHGNGQSSRPTPGRETRPALMLDCRECACGATAKRAVGHANVKGG